MFHRMKMLIALCLIWTLLGCSDGDNKRTSVCASNTEYGLMCRDSVGYCRCINVRTDCTGKVEWQEQANYCAGNTCDAHCP